MSVRTSPDRVKGALLDNYGARADGSLPPLDPFIKRASLLVDRVATCAATKGITLSSEETRELETLLAAHFYQAADPGYMSRTTGKSNASFEGQSGMKLERTRYGQDALVLDYSGCLEAIDKRKFVGAVWLGKNFIDQTAYEDR